MQIAHRCQNRGCNLFITNYGSSDLLQKTYHMSRRGLLDKGRVQKKVWKIPHLLLTHPPNVEKSSFGTKLKWKFFHLENFSTSSICGLVLIIKGHGGSLECKRG